MNRSRLSLLAAVAASLALAAPATAVKPKDGGFPSKPKKNGSFLVLYAAKGKITQITLNLIFKGPGGGKCPAFEGAPSGPFSTSAVPVKKRKAKVNKDTGKFSFAVKSQSDIGQGGDLTGTISGKFTSKKKGRATARLALGECKTGKYSVKVKYTQGG